MESAKDTASKIGDKGRGNIGNPRNVYILVLINIRICRSKRIRQRHWSQSRRERPWLVFIFCFIVYTRLKFYIDLIPDVKESLKDAGSKAKETTKETGSRVADKGHGETIALMV